MIRDPSDGSVREKRPVETALAPAPKDAKEAARLEKSRKFVRDYHAGKRSPEQGEG